MTTRFWAPVRASTEPDGVVLAMLDPETGDLGTKILAAHRAGASACDVVRKGAVPSEQGLIAALRLTRAAVADPMVTGIAKSLGGSYAGLLVRDIWDDGEQGALDLFRAAVAKGVSPPIAVTRVGEVFGVPMSELGPYVALAVDPKSSPIALTDAADRALLRYVSKINALESQDVLEEVSKAPAAEQQRSTTKEAWDESKVHRAGDGQFAPQTATGGVSVMDRLRQRLGISAAPDVAGEQKAADAKEAERTRQTRQQRQKRQTRQTRQAAPRAALRPTGQRVGAQRQGGDRARGKRTAKRISDRAKAAVAERNSGIFVPPHINEAPKIVEIDNAMARLPDDEGADYEELTSPMTLAVELHVGLAFQGSTVDPHTPTDRRRVFRMGYLTDLAGRPELFDTAEGNEARMAAATKELDHPDNAEYVEPGSMDLHKLAGMPEQDLYDLVSRQKQMIAGNDEEELSSIVEATDYDTGQQLLVHLRPTDEENPDEYRPRPTVTEYVVDSARGRVEGRTYTGRRQHLEYHLDPNQAFSLDHTPQVLYDTANSVFVHRYHLVPISDEQANDIERDVSKALSPAERVNFNQRVARDEDGQFAPVTERRSGVAPTQEPARVDPVTRQVRQTRQARQKRQVRQTRRASQVRNVERPAAQRQQAQRHSERKAAIRTGISQAVARSVRQQTALTEMPVLDDARAYRVLTKAEFTELLDHNDSTHADVIPITSHRSLEILQQDLVNGEGASGTLGMNVDRQVRAQEGGFYGTNQWGEEPSNRKNYGTWMAKTPADFEQLGERVHALFKQHPDLAQLQIMDALDGTSRVHLWGSKKPVDPQVVIEMEDDLDLTQPIELVHVSNQQSIDARRRRRDVPGELMTSLVVDDEPYNVDLRLYLLANTKVRRYRAQNRDDGYRPFNLDPT